MTASQIKMIIRTIHVNWKQIYAIKPVLLVVSLHKSHEGFFGDSWKVFGIAPLTASARFEDGAYGAQRGLAMANGGAQFHEGLVVVSGAVGVEQVLGEGAKLSLSGGPIAEFLAVGEQAGKDADDVSVRHGGFGLKAYAGDGGRYIGTYAGELFPIGGIGGRFVEGGDFLGEFAEVADSRVVTKTFPCLQDRFLGGFSEGREVGKGFQPVLKVGEYGCDARLLEHHLR